LQEQASNHLKLLGSRVLVQPSELGTPQGGPLSPLLANILLDELDRELERRGLRFARYADDLIILVKSQRAGQRVKRSVTAFLARRLKLPVNEHKSKVAPIGECVFLGFTFRGTKLCWSPRAFADFKHRVRELTARS
jgi:RNA-directed DNA polymerase